MIEVHIQEEEQRIVIEIKGHAGYAAEGVDVVCAATSTLLYTLLSRIEELHIDGVIYCMKPGHSKFEIDNTKEAKQVLSVIESGWRALEKQYPSYIGINRGEIKK